MTSCIGNNPEAQKKVILEVLEQLRMRKSRPDFYRISFLVQRQYDISKEVTQKCLDELISSNIITRVEFKGNHSYRYVHKKKLMTNREKNIICGFIKEAITILTVPNEKGIIIKKQGVSNRDIRKWIVKNKRHPYLLINKNIAWLPLLKGMIRKKSITRIRNGRYVLFGTPFVLTPPPEQIAIDSNLSNESEYRPSSSNDCEDASDVPSQISQTFDSDEKKPSYHLPKISITSVASLENSYPTEKRKRTWRRREELRESTSDCDNDNDDGASPTTDNESSVDDDDCSTATSLDTASHRRAAPPPLAPLVISVSPAHCQPRPSPLNNLPRCDFCLQTSAKSDRAVEQLLYCRDCQAKAHPSCMNYSVELAKRARLTKWQCIDCKICCICSDDRDSIDEMLFCDSCDRGYHMHCHFPEIDSKPIGNWECSECYEKMFETNNKELIEKLCINNNCPPNGTLVDPKKWSVEEVVVYFSDKGFSEQSQVFQNQEIDGSSLILLKRSDVIGASSLLSLRLGPALKIFQIIEALRKQSDQCRYERLENSYVVVKGRG